MNSSGKMFCANSHGQPGVHLQSHPLPASAIHHDDVIITTAGHWVLQDILGISDEC